MTSLSNSDLKTLKPILTHIKKNCTKITVKYKQMKSAIMSVYGMTDTQELMCFKATKAYEIHLHAHPVNLEKFVGDYSLYKTKKQIKTFLPNFRVSMESVVFLLTYLRNI